jgi:hypothetical protein
MNINELDSYNLADAVKFHRRLNPRIWGRDEQLLPEVRERLLAIAADFQEFLGVEELNIEDITISGSNAAYSYTKNSDIDLHIVVTMPDDPVYQELFNAKKYQYNDEHNIRIGGADVELYVQPADQAHHSQGIYSIKNNEWLQVPQRKRAQVDDSCVRDKVSDLDSRIHSAVKSKNAEVMATLWNKIKAMRKSGLEQHGEFGCENIAFKTLRNSGCIKLLKDAMTAAQDRELSLREADRPQPRFRYGFSEGMQSQPYSTSDGVAASTKQFLEDSESDDSIVQDFIQHVTTELGIVPVPEIHLHTDPKWSEHNQSFGRYDPDTHTLNVSMSNRHVMDVLRTVAHELVHCNQNQQHSSLPDDAGETGSRWENDANARAGIIMRDWANSHPEHFAHDSLEESASGYIPKNKREAAMPQYAMALSVDIKPGQIGKEANKLGLKTNKQGKPGLLINSANLQESLAAEFELFEEQDLFEINMGSKNLRREAAKTGAIAGMEFEMIVPGIKSEDPEMEPDYDQDERCRSIDDAVSFFHDGDYNGRREVERLRERMQNDYQEWLDEKLYRDWERSGEEYLEEWVPNNVDESEWNPDSLEGEARQEALEEYIANLHSDSGSSDAFDEFREENYGSYDESDWLDAEDLDRMSGVENAYEISWPHWTSMNSGEIDADQVADEFSQAVGREVRVNTRYHQSGARPDPNNQFYVVEPDGSLEGDNDGDEGLEFVSPPMPIDELLKDLNAVKAWAGRMGVYTNQSTGLHINISVPEYSKDRLDFVKLALLLGDEYVLDLFGRASNTYAKSALGKVRDRVRQRPEEAKQLLDKMKGQMGELASKAIHGGYTDKYTSINTKDGHIEFRSPGGDWLDDNFDKIENTLLRFTVAMSAALNPEAYKEEYQKKLYKLLTQDQKDSDTIRYFADYVAGKIPRAALRSFVKQAQLQRKEKRGETSGEKMWWRVSNPGNSYASVEVVATSREEAIEKALGDDGYPSWANTRQSVVAEPVRPYEEKPAQQAQPQSTGRTSGEPIPGSTIDLQRQRAAQAQQIPEVPLDIEVNYPQASSAPAGNSFSGQWKVLVNGEEVWRFRGVGNSQADANRLAAQWLRNNGRGVSGEGFEVVPIMTESVAEAFDQPYKTKTEKSDYGDVDMLARLPDGTNLSIMFNKQQNNEGEETIQVEFYRNNSQEVTGEGDAQKIFATVLTSIQKYIKKYKPARLSFSASKATDPTIYYEPDQPQPNPESRAKLYDRLVQRYARAWGYRAFRADTGDLVIYELSRLQPAVAEGKDRYGNFDPPGPESPPTMPAGTVRVDVSDVYDWYKLGQHISNMKGLGKHDFGKGPPSAIISFGDEDLEHQYIQALKKTGLTTTDIDPVDPNQPPGMPRQKTDPTYNVDENFADGKNPGRKGLSKRVGVNTKASVSSLRKTAKNSSGEKQRMAHWLANMKAGRAKAKRK